MSFYDKQTTRVEIDEDHTITIQRLSYGQRQRCISVAAIAKVDENRQETMTIDPGRLSIERLVYGIIAWEGPGFEGRVVNRENIEDLPPEVLDPVTAALSNFDDGPSESQKKA